jgi:hypothetical protein
MSGVKRIVCLANSRKLSGRCVAGKEWDGTEPGAWLRPVSSRETQEVEEEERRYEDGSDPSLLDIIDIPVLKHTPNHFQSENWVLDPKFYWRRTGKLDVRDLRQLLDNTAELWLNGNHTGAGLNDRVTHAEAQQLSNSLYLLRVDNLRLRVFAPGADFGNPKRRVQAKFSHRDVDYWLWVTDPKVERQYLAEDDGEYEVGAAFLTISLGEPHDGYCYKLVAAIIPCT